MKTLSDVSYMADGSVALSSTEPDEEWTDHVPDTIGENNANSLCRLMADVYKPKDKKKD